MAPQQSLGYNAFQFNGYTTSWSTRFGPQVCAPLYLVVMDFSFKGSTIVYNCKETDAGLWVVRPQPF